MLDSSQQLERPEKELGALFILALSLLALWTLWALALRPLVPSGGALQEEAIAIASRLLFWGVPSAVYLSLVWGKRYWEPLGLSFPLGAPQVIRTLLVTFFVSFALVAATAAQQGRSVFSELAFLGQNLQLRLTAPILEELVFRGIVLSELLNWVHSGKRTAGKLRLRFWLSQLAAAGLFLLVHWPYWCSHYGLRGALQLSLPVFTTGFILGFVFANTRSIWPCIFLHWLNNELSLLS